MHVDLTFSPLTGVTTPYLSTPVLSAYVKSESAHSASQMDLNLRLVSYLLEPDVLSSYVHRAARFVEEMGQTRMDGADAMRFARCAMLATSGPSLIEALPHALDVVRSDRALFEPGEVALADRIIAEALNAVTALTPPAFLDFCEPVYTVQAGDPLGLRVAVASEESLFAQWYDCLIGPEELRGDVVGISIVYNGQVLPGLSLAQWVRKRRPSARVLVGG